MNDPNFVLELVAKIGGALVFGSTIIWGYRGLIARVDRLEEKFGDHKHTYEAKCDENEAQIKEVEHRLGTRMTQGEINQGKLQELIYKSMENINDKMATLSAVIQDISGYMRAQDNQRPQRRKPRQ